MDKTSKLFTSRIFRKSRSKSSVRTYLRAVEQFAKFLGYESLDGLAEGMHACRPSQPFQPYANGKSY